MEPSAAPAPTRVCNSSMKRIIWPSDSGDFLQERLQPVFKFAAVFRARYQSGEIERGNSLRFEGLRHVAGYDSLRKAFHDGRLADARLANQHGSVFCAPGEDLHHAANFFVAANYRIDLAAPRLFRQVPSILFDRTIGSFGILGRYAMAAANRRHRLQDRVVAGAAAREELACGIAIGSGNSKQNMLG